MDFQFKLIEFARKLEDRAIDAIQRRIDGLEAAGCVEGVKDTAVNLLVEEFNRG